MRKKSEPNLTIRPAFTVGRRQFLVGAAAVGLSAPFVLREGRGAELTKVSITFGAPGSFYCADYVAATLGMDKEQGLKFHLIVTNSGGAARDILAAGQAQYSHGDSSHPLQLDSRHMPSKILMATETTCSYGNLVVRKDLYEKGITTPEKLADWKRPDGEKPRIAANSIGSGTWVYGTYIFEQLGKGKNIHWINGGSATAMLGALKTKQIDAIVASPARQFEAQDHGWGEVIFDVTNQAAWNKIFGGPLPVMIVYGLTDTVEKKKEQTQAVVNTLYKAMQWLKTASVDEIYAKIGRKWLGDLDEAARKRELAYYKKAWHYSCTVPKADYERAGKVLFRQSTGIKPVPYKEAVDTRFITKARAKFG